MHRTLITLKGEVTKFYRKCTWRSHFSDICVIFVGFLSCRACSVQYIVIIHQFRNQLLPPPKKGSYVFKLVCLSVCLSDCPLDYSENYEQILVKFFGGVGHGQAPSD